MTPTTLTDAEREAQETRQLIESIYVDGPLSESEQAVLLDIVENASQRIAAIDEARTVWLDIRTAAADLAQAGGVPWTTIAKRGGVVRQVILRQVTDLREGSGGSQ